MNHKLLSLPVLGLSTALGVAFVPPAEEAAPARPTRYQVTVTNMTRGQVFSPAVVAVHSRAMTPLWEAGETASTELAQVAEDAVLGPLTSALQADPQVMDVETLDHMGGPIPPGQSASVMVSAMPGVFDRVSLVGMLVTTNDAFYGVAGHELSVRADSAFRVPAYDAGSEANTEMCAHIPGPPCGNAGVRVTTGAEGFVHIHAGVQGTGDLVPADHDWRNPVARIEVRRMHR